MCAGASSAPDEGWQEFWRNRNGRDQVARRDLTGAINFVHLDAYTAGDAALTEEVLALFEEQASLWMRLLTPEAPADSWRDAAHTLKGGALGIGADALARACSEAEQNALTATATRAALLDPIHAELNAVLADIAAWRHQVALDGLRG
jgi:HPt (histidine-containing phosphotransfer) domain-containing protein